VIRGRAAAALSTSAVVILAVAVLYRLRAATQGEYLLVVAPAVGMVVGLSVWGALRRLCTTGSRSAEAIAVGGVVVLPVVAIVGISFGGIALLLPAALLAVAGALTPRPRTRGIC